MAAQPQAGKGDVLDYLAKKGALTPELAADARRLEKKLIEDIGREGVRHMLLNMTGNALKMPDPPPAPAAKPAATTVTVNLADGPATVQAIGQAVADAMFTQQNRAAQIKDICEAAGKSNLAARYIADGATADEVRASIIGPGPVTCIEDVALATGKEDDARYRSEYDANPHLRAKMSFEHYAESRRKDEGKAPVNPADADLLFRDYVRRESRQTEARNALASAATANDVFKAEWQRSPVMQQKISLPDYIATRRIDEGLDTLTPKRS